MKNRQGLLFSLGAPGRWDDRAVSCPTVIRTDDGRWRMWYYGRESNFPGGGIEGGGDGIPMGRTGYAESADGISWTRVDGPGTRGSVLDPTYEDGRFDNWAVGGSDVVILPSGEHRMYYMGARQTAGLFGGELRKGFPLCTGVATSPDGLRFTKIDGEHPDKSIVANGGPDDWDHWFAAWPRVLPLPGGGWRMYYHGRGNAQPSSVGVAESADGIRWEKRGMCFGPNPDTAAFDAGAVSTRHVIPWQGGYLMAYEALPKGGGPPAYRIGLATSKDGLTWERLPGPSTLGCVLDKGDPDAWDYLSIGTPYLVPEPDGGLRLYYVGFWLEPDGPRSGIGLAFADRKDITRWEKVQFA